MLKSWYNSLKVDPAQPALYQRPLDFLMQERKTGKEVSSQNPEARRQAG
jgi:hypothetical protein